MRQSSWRQTISALRRRSPESSWLRVSASVPHMLRVRPCALMVTTDRRSPQVGAVAPTLLGAPRPARSRGRALGE